MKFRNISSAPDWQVLQWFDGLFYRDFLEEAVILPDVSPGGLIPNGVAAVVKPDWTDHFPFDKAIGDIGCGMSWAAIPGFDMKRLKESWNSLYSTLSSKTALLGSGNHFIDGCRGEGDRFVMVVHLGSRASSAELKEFVYYRDYAGYLERAEKNHRDIWANISRALGVQVDPVFLPHDTVTVEDGKTILRKGVTCSPGGSPFFIASSFDDVLVTGVTKPAISELFNSMSHGTGRLTSRSEAKLVPVDQDDLRKRIVIPKNLPDSSWKLESPAHYRRSEQVLDAVDRYIEIREILNPMAYMGGF